MGWGGACSSAVLQVEVCMASDHKVASSNPDMGM